MQVLRYTLALRGGRAARHRSPHAFVAARPARSSANRPRTSGNQVAVAGDSAHADCAGPTIGAIDIFIVQEDEEFLVSTGAANADYTAPTGTFASWMIANGNAGGQRKVPRVTAQSAATMFSTTPQHPERLQTVRRRPQRSVAIVTSAPCDRN